MKSKILLSSALASTVLLSQVNISDAAEKTNEKSEVSEIIKDKKSKIKSESPQIKIKNSVNNQSDNGSTKYSNQDYSEPGKFDSSTKLYDFGVGDSRSGSTNALNLESKMSDNDVSIKHKDVVDKKSNIAYVLTPSGNNDNLYFAGTAFAIDNHTLITNDHVIRDHTDDSGFKPHDASQVKINPNRDTSKEYVPQEITPTNIKMLKSADAAIITVKEDLSKTMTISKIADESSINDMKQNDDITVSGYPGSQDHAGEVGGSYGPKGTPYDSKAKFISNATSIHPVAYYKGYFEKGMSGSPIYNNNGEIIGVHAGAVGSENGNKADVGYGYTFTKEFRKNILEALPQLDTSKADEPKADEPKAEDPKTDEPKNDEPKADEPKAEDPKTDEPKNDEPKADEPKTEDPKTEDPKAEDPKTDEPKNDEPKVEDPKDDDLKADEPKVEDPKVDEPSNEDPKDDEPSTEDPKDDEPSNEDPKDDEPSTENPKDDEPKDEDPKGDEPSTEDPKDDEPSNDEPSNDEPSNDEPSTEDPKDDEPSIENPKDDDTSNDNTSNNNTTDSNKSDNESKDYDKDDELSKDLDNISSDNNTNDSQTPTKIEVSDGLDRDVNKDEEDKNRQNAIEKTNENKETSKDESKDESKDKSKDESKEKDNKDEKDDKDNKESSKDDSENKNDKETSKDDSKDKNDDESTKNDSKDDYNNDINTSEKANNETPKNEPYTNNNETPSTEPETSNDESVSPNVEDNNDSVMPEPIQQVAESLPDTGSTIGNIGLYGSIILAAAGGSILLARKFLTK